MPQSPSLPQLSLCLATYNRARYLDRYLTHHLTAFEAAGVDSLPGFFIATGGLRHMPGNS